MIGTMVPHVHFPVRVRDDSIGGDNPYRWATMSSTDIFENRKVVVFSLPGAFTPTCSTYQLPHFERLWAEFMRHGIDDIYCLSVNDSFVMNAWGKSQNLERVKLIPDGSGTFTRLMGMLVDKDNLGFGYRSWRYAMIVEKIQGNPIIYTTSEIYDLSLSGKFELAADWLDYEPRKIQSAILEKYNNNNDKENGKLAELFRSLQQIKNFYKIDLVDFQDNIIDEGNRYVIVDLGF